MLFTPLHRLLGRPPGPLTDDMIDEAVTLQLAETDDLDWKAEAPETGGLSRHDIVKDMAAMANSGGGLLVYGVTETDSRASGRQNVGVRDERYETALTSVALSAITPPIFGVKVYQLGQPDLRAIVVVIPESDEVPHLVYRNEYFGAPRRNGAATTWLREREVESMYRARFDARRYADTALAELSERALDGYRRGALTFVAVARPSIEVTRTEAPPRSEARELMETAQELTLRLSNSNGGHPLDHLHTMHPRTGLRRWQAWTVPGTRQWDEARVAIHHDGSVTVVTEVGGRPRMGASAPPWVVNTVELESAVADFMALIRVVGEQRGIPAYVARVTVYSGVQQAMMLEIGDEFGQPTSGGSVPIPSFEPIELSVRTDVTLAEYHQAVRQLALDCTTQGGVDFLRVVLESPRP